MQQLLLLFESIAVFCLPSSQKLNHPLFMTFMSGINCVNIDVRYGTLKENDEAVKKIRYKQQEIGIGHQGVRCKCKYSPFLISILFT